MLNIYKDHPVKNSLRIFATPPKEGNYKVQIYEKFTFNLRSKIDVLILKFFKNLMITVQSKTYNSHLTLIFVA